MARKAIVLSFFSFFLLLLITGAQSGAITLKNNCPFTVWPGTLADLGKPQLSTTGFTLSSGCSISINALPGWSGQFWARTECTVDPTTLKFSCLTGDCGSGQVECNGAGAIPPVTLAELVIADQNSTIDYYQISLVGGFNLPVSVWPEGGSGTCDLAICKANVNVVCPPTLAVIGSDGCVVACRSACVAFGQPQYCCTGLFGSPETCPPTEYSNIFKSQCPKAYTYAFDHQPKSFSCSGGASYVVTFCPY